MKEIVTSRAVIMTETNDSSRYRECFNCSCGPSGKNTTKNKPDSFCFSFSTKDAIVGSTILPPYDT